MAWYGEWWVNDPEKPNEWPFPDAKVYLAAAVAAAVAVYLLKKRR